MIITVVIAVVVGLIILYYCFLSANPWSTRMSKDKILSYVPEPFALNTRLLKKSSYLSDLKYPVIFKPVVCNGNGKGVKKINNVKEAIEYMKVSEEQFVIAQEYYPGKFEVGVLYERYPFDASGSIVSIVSKETGDDWKPLRCNTCSYKGGVDCFIIKSTQKLQSTIDHIAKKIPDFYVGRFDIRFYSLDDFLNGENFKIIEVNGVMGFDLRTSIDSSKCMFTTVKNVLYWVARRVLIGLQNIVQLNGGNVFEVFDISTKFSTYQKCRDYEHLFQPSSA